MKPRCSGLILFFYLPAMLLCGCQAPQEKVADQSARLSQSLDDLFGRIDAAADSAGKTKTLADRTEKGAQDLDHKVPADDPTKPVVTTLAANARATAASAGETREKTKLAAGAKLYVEEAAAELSETAAQLAKAQKESWLTWAFRLAPIVLGILLALLIGLVDWKGTLAVLNLLKPVVVPMLIGVAALGLINLILAMIPTWMWWAGGIVALLALIAWLLYRLVPAVRAMSQTIAGSSEAQALAAKVKELGAHVGSLLEGIGTKVTPKR